MQRQNIRIATGTLLIVGVVLYFLLSGDQTGTKGDQTPPAIVQSVMLASGSQSTLSKPTNYVITSSEQLEQLWKLIRTNAPPPTVDFTKNDILAVFAGEVPTEGYAIAVSRVEDSTTRMVFIELAKPGISCVLAKSPTRPYQIVAVPKTSLPLAHTDLERSVSCLTDVGS